MRQDPAVRRRDDDEGFAADDRTQDAVIRNIEIIGEAAKNIPDATVATAPEIAWRNVRGMRDILAHGYFQTSLEIVWATATQRVDEIERAVRKLLGSPSGS